MNKKLGVVQMNTLTRSLTVMLAAAGAAAAQSSPQTTKIPGWTDASRVCPAVAVDCAPGYRPFVDPNSCAAVCLPLDKETRPTRWNDAVPEPPKCPGCQPEPKPEPKPVPPRSWENDAIPLSGGFSGLKDAVGQADLESAAGRLLKIWGGAVKPKFRKASCPECDKDGTKWGGSTGNPPSLPPINKPSNGGGSSGGGNSGGSSGGSSGSGNAGGGTSAPPVQQPQQQPQQQRPKELSLPPSVIVNK